MKHLATLTFLAAMASPLSAAIYVSSNALTDGAPATLTITTDLHFSITAEPINEAVIFVFNDWTPTVGNSHHTQLSTQFEYSLNGGTVQLGDTSSLVDHWGTDDLGRITRNSGYIYFFTPTPLSVGDTLTLKAGVYSFTGNSALNPDILQPFTGDIQITDDFGTPIGPAVTVPEPSAALLGAVGALALLHRRRD